MALTLSQMLTRIRQNTGCDNTTTYPDSQLTAYLNDAQRECARRHNWNDLLTEDTTSIDTVAGTKRYTLPTNTNILLGVRLEDTTSSRWLYERSRAWLNQYEPYPEGLSNARPDIYVWEAGLIELFPIPDAAYDIYLTYIKWATDLAVSADDSDITNIDDTLVAYGTAELYRALGQYDHANHWTLVYERRLAMAIARDTRRPAWLPQNDGIVGPRPQGPPAEYWNRVWW